MKHVEFSNTPPLYEISNKGEFSIIRFYDNVREVTDNAQEEEHTVYETDCYEIETRTATSLKSRIERNYDKWLAFAKETDGGLVPVKNEKILLSKKMLASYLSSHPIKSSAHGGVEGLYSVTEEKQALMASQYISYQAEKLLNPDAKLTWNETGKACEVWTEEEFLQLIVEIKGYVYPLVSYQQHIEEMIASATTLSEIESIVIDYEHIQ